MSIFNRVKNFFRFGKEGLRVDYETNFAHITDHPKIGISQEEYQRILDNKRMYAGNFKPVKYRNSNGYLVERPYKFINTPKKFAARLTKLLLNEDCKIKIDNKQADEFLRDVFVQNKFMSNLIEELEAGYAVNGLAIRPYVENSKIKFSFCSAGTFFPIKARGNNIEEAVIADKTEVSEKGKKIYYTLLEFHEWEDGIYVITNELYKSEKRNELGRRVKLHSLEQYKNLEAKVRLKHLSRSLFVYIKLAGKNNITDSPMGLGIIDNAKSQLTDINDKYDLFMFEADEAGRIITASGAHFKTKYDENGNPIQLFDNKTKVFQKLHGDLDGHHDIKEFVPSLRSKEFIETINFIINIAETSVGFSPGTFVFDGKSIKTATEVISENSETYQLREQNAQVLGVALKELITSVFELAQASGLYNSPLDFDISIDFDDGVFTDRRTEIDFYNKGVVGKLIPRQEAIKRVFKRTDKQAAEWLKMIVEEEKLFNPEYEHIRQEIELGAGSEI